MRLEYNTKPSSDRHINMLSNTNHTVTHCITTHPGLHGVLLTLCQRSHPLCRNLLPLGSGKRPSLNKAKVAGFQAPKRLLHERQHRLVLGVGCLELDARLDSHAVAVHGDAGGLEHAFHTGVLLQDLELRSAWVKENIIAVGSDQEENKMSSTHRKQSSSPQTQGMAYRCQPCCTLLLGPGNERSDQAPLGQLRGSVHAQEETSRYSSGTSQPCNDSTAWNAPSAPCAC